MPRSTALQPATPLRGIACTALCTLVLAACSGGSDFGSEYPVVQVDSVTVDQAIKGQTTTFTIKGSNLTQEFILTSPSCEGPILDNEATSDTVRTATCVIGSGGDVEVSIEDIGHGQVVYTNPKLATAASNTKISAISVAAPAAGTLATWQYAQFTITGEKLDEEKGLVLRSDSCSDGRVTMDENFTSATTRTGSCILHKDAAGPLSIKAYYKENIQGQVVEAPFYSTPSPIATVTVGAEPKLALSAENGVTVADLKYSQKANFTFAGTNLANNFSAKSNSCADGNITLDAVTDTTGKSRTGSCTILKTGPIELSLYDSAGTRAYYTPIANLVPNPQISISTRLGSFVVTLAPSIAPKTVQNMLALTASGYYEGTALHEVLPNDIVRGGAYTQSETGAQLTAKAAPDGGNTIALESGSTELSNTKGTIVMDKTDSKATLSSRTAFFFNIKDHPEYNKSSTDPGYAVFGQVIEADLPKLVELSNEAEVTTGTFANGSKTATATVPQTPLVIQSIKQIR